PQMLAAGLNVTINTDDPSISQITLGEEYYTVCEQLEVPLATLRQRVLAAANASFLPPEARTDLVSALEQEFPVVND
ncbi:MAG TPA: hypothetical protein VIK64_13280, partial [Anaerolineales bacterium]